MARSPKEIIRLIFSSRYHQIKIMKELGELVYPHELATAHIMIKCRAGSENKVVENIEKINAVKDIHRTIGEFDIIVKVEAIDFESLRDIIRRNIFTSNYVESITTLMCMRKSMCVVVK